MAIDIKVGDLASRAIRNNVTPGGIKRFATSQYTAIQNSEGGFGGFAIEIAKKFFGFLLWAVLGIVKWSLTLIWQWVCSTVSFIWNFDWNKSDETIEAEWKASVNAFGSTLGSALGSTLGWAVTGAVGGAVAFAFNEPLAVHILNEFGEEALEEISQQMLGVLRSGFRVASRGSFNWLYKTGRSFIEGKSDDMYLTDAQLAEAVANGSMTQEIADKNKKGRDALKKSRERKPYSFALNWEKYVESIDNGFLKNFIEEFWEEFWDAVQEGGYVMFSSADAWYSSNRQVQTNISRNLAAGHVVQVQLDRSQITGNTQA